MRKVNISSPKKITYGELSSFLSFRKSVEDLYDYEILCDCSGLTFVDPLGLCLLKHWFVELDERGVSIQLHGLQLYMESYLSRMDLFKGLNGVSFQDNTSANRRNDLSGNIFELRTIDSLSDIEKIASQVATTIVHGIPEISFEPDPDGMTVSTAERLEDTLQYVFSEILNNALDHGRKFNYLNATANIAAQYYWRSKKLEIGILDNGCGLLETLRGHEKMEGDLSDDKAISIAYQPRVSCNRDAELGLDTRNQGVGLTVSSKIARAANGQCGIFSGGSRHSLFPSGIVDRVSIPYWRGTGVYFLFDKGALALAGVNKNLIIEELPGFKTNKRINFV